VDIYVYIKDLNTCKAPVLSMRVTVQIYDSITVYKYQCIKMYRGGKWINIGTNAQTDKTHTLS
jgi:hypothetical protein